MAHHFSINFKTQQYYENEDQFIGVYKGFNLRNAYIINGTYIVILEHICFC